MPRSDSFAGPDVQLTSQGAQKQPSCPEEGPTSGKACHRGSTGSHVGPCGFTPAMCSNITVTDVVGPNGRSEAELLSSTSLAGPQGSSSRSELSATPVLTVNSANDHSRVHSMAAGHAVSCNVRPQCVGRWGPVLTTVAGCSSNPEQQDMPTTASTELQSNGSTLPIQPLTGDHSMVEDTGSATSCSLGITAAPTAAPTPEMGSMGLWKTRSVAPSPDVPLAPIGPPVAAATSGEEGTEISCTCTAVSPHTANAPAAAAASQACNQPPARVFAGWPGDSPPQDETLHMSFRSDGRIATADVHGAAVETAKAGSLPRPTASIGMNELRLQKLAARSLTEPLPSHALDMVCESVAASDSSVVRPESQPCTATACSDVVVTANEQAADGSPSISPQSTHGQSSCGTDAANGEGLGYWSPACGTRGQSGTARWWDGNVGDPAGCGSPSCSPRSIWPLVAAYSSEPTSPGSAACGSPSRSPRSRWPLDATPISQPTSPGCSPRTFAAKLGRRARADSFADAVMQQLKGAVALRREAQSPATPSSLHSEDPTRAAEHCIRPASGTIQSAGETGMEIGVPAIEIALAAPAGPETPNAMGPRAEAAMDAGMPISSIADVEGGSLSSAVPVVMDAIGPQTAAAPAAVGPCLQAQAGSSAAQIPQLKGTQAHEPCQSPANSSLATSGDQSSRSAESDVQSSTLQHPHMEQAAQLPGKECLAPMAIPAIAELQNAGGTRQGHDSLRAMALEGDCHMMAQAASGGQAAVTGMQQVDGSPLKTSSLRSSAPEEAAARTMTPADSDNCNAGPSQHTNIGPLEAPSAGALPNAADVPTDAIPDATAFSPAETTAHPWQALFVTACASAAQQPYGLLPQLPKQLPQQLAHCDSASSPAQRQAHLPPEIMERLSAPVLCLIQRTSNHEQPQAETAGLALINPDMSILASARDAVMALVPGDAATGSSAASGRPAAETNDDRATATMPPGPVSGLERMEQVAPGLLQRGTADTGMAQFVDDDAMVDAKLATINAYLRGVSHATECSTEGSKQVLSLQCNGASSVRMQRPGNREQRGCTYLTACKLFL